MNFSCLVSNCRIIRLTLIVFQLSSCGLLPISKPATQASLEAWLKIEATRRPAFVLQSFAHQDVAVDTYKKQQKLLYEDRARTLQKKLKIAWDKQLFSWNKHQMSLKFKLFGNPTMGQRSLFLSMHGGGGAAASVNDQQWKNQLNLYQPKEGLYIAPRAPTNTWNLWHQAHIDPLFDQIINAAVLLKGVDPNRIYLTGYSAGGDGTFQLAARMGDRFAAAAMMAGHPNEVRAESMRNLPFALYMGANDSAYERNKKALGWKQDLRQLHQKDPKGYVHKVEIVANKGHWMDRIDTAAISWMQEFRRNVRPDKIVWIQDDVHQEQSYWLRIPKSLARTGQKIIAKCHNNHIQIEENYSDTLYIYLDKQMIDLDKPVFVSFKETLLYKNKVHGTLFNIYRNLQRRLDIDMAFPICLVLLKNEVVMLNPIFD